MGSNTMVVWCTEKLELNYKITQRGAGDRQGTSNVELMRVLLLIYTGYA
jgi:hypothetical protein